MKKRNVEKQSNVECQNILILLPTDVIWNYIFKLLYPEGRRNIPLVCKEWNEFHKTLVEKRWSFFKNSTRYGIVTSLCYYMECRELFCNIFIKYQGDFGKPNITIQPRMSMPDDEPFHFESSYQFIRLNTDRRAPYTYEEREYIFPIETWMHNMFVAAFRDITAYGPLIEDHKVIADTHFIDLYACAQKSRRMKFMVDMLNEFPYEKVHVSHFDVGQFGNANRETFLIKWNTVCVNIRIEMMNKVAGGKSGERDANYYKYMCKTLNIEGIFLENENKTELDLFESELIDIYNRRYKHENLLMYITWGLW